MAQNYYMKFNRYFLLLYIPLQLFAGRDIPGSQPKASYAIGKEKIDAEIQIGNTLATVSRDSSLIHFRLACELAKALQEPGITADTYYQFGLRLYRFGMMDSARVYLEQALGLSKAQNDSAKMGILDNILGNVYWYQDKQVLAREAFMNALNINLRVGRAKEIGKSYNNLANMYRKWDDYKNAIELFLKASDYYQKADFSEGVAWLSYSISLLYKSAEDYENALLSANKSLEIYKTLLTGDGDSTGLMICYGQLGDIYSLTGDYEKGLQYHFAALRLRKKTGVAAAIADGYAGIGKIYYLTGKYALAKYYFLQSNKLRQKSKISSGSITNYKYLGLIAYKKGHPARALQTLKLGLKMAVESKKLSAQAELLKEISGIYSASGQARLALQYFHQYDTIRESLYQSKLDKQLSVFGLRTVLNKKQKENERLVLDYKIKNLELEKSNTARNVLLLVAAVFILLTTFIVYLYRRKAEANRLLESQNKAISEARQQLEHEIAERKVIESQREKLIGQLEESIGKIKTLSGLIPICSSCKKIRNDDGYYEQIEEYLRQHTEASFTHGLCPDCAEKLLTEIKDDNKHAK